MLVIYAVFNSMYLANLYQVKIIFIIFQCKLNQASVSAACMRAVKHHNYCQV